MEENYPSASGDHRWQVQNTDQALKNPPYCHIVRVTSQKTCCDTFDNGTAFLVANESVTHCYYLTAAHLLFCNIEEHRGKERLVKRVQLWESVKEGGSDSELIAEIYSNGAYKSDKAWYKVNPLYQKTVQDCQERLGHDLAVIAVLNDDMKGKHTKEGGFRAVPGLAMSDNYPDCLVSGFPGKAPNQGGGGGEAGTTGGQSADADPGPLNEMIYEHQGVVGTYKSNGRLWKSGIHTTKGQSGSPVFVKSTRTLVGMHILGGDEHNLALKLDNEIIAAATSGFDQQGDEVDGRAREALPAAAARFMPDPPRPARVQQVEKNHWDDIFIPLSQDFAELPKTILVGIGRHCMAARLIPQADFNELGDFRQRKVADELRKLLTVTGNMGFFEFKTILCNWTGCQAPAVFLEKMKKKERQVYGHVLT